MPGGLAILAIALNLPLALRALQLEPDAVEFMDIARHLARGEGYLLAIKPYYVDGSPVVHDGLVERAPLVPWLFALLLRLGLGPTAFQALNGLIYGACVALICAIGSSLFGRRVGLLAAVTR
jgi:hypothetical protein